MRLKGVFCLEILRVFHDYFQVFLRSNLGDNTRWPTLRAARSFVLVAWMLSHGR